jgi:hypothetical protein
VEITRGIVDRPGETRACMLHSLCGRSKGATLEYVKCRERPSEAGGTTLESNH